MAVAALVAPGVRRISLPLPFALRAVNAYLVEGSSGWTLVDAGLHTDEGERTLRAGLAEAGIGLAGVRRVFITHVHPDHIGMAGTLAGAGAEVVMHRPEADHARRLWARDGRLVEEAYAWFLAHGMPEAVDDEMRQAWLGMASRVDPIGRIAPVEDGEVLDLGGRALRVRWTPGHTDHHAVLVDEGEQVLFAGDHVLPAISPNISLYPWSRDDPLGDFLGALRAARGLPVRRVLPAHGEPFDDLAGRVDELLEHHQRRLAAVRNLARGDGRHAYALCRDLFPVLRSAHEERFALAETLAHLRHLELRREVERLGGTPVRWRTATA